MVPDRDTTLRLVRELVDEMRTRCLWYMRKGYQPQTIEDALWVLNAIEKRSDLATFQRIGELRTWLSRHIKPASASS